MSSDIYLRTASRADSCAESTIAEPAAAHVADLRHICTNLDCDTLTISEALTILPKPELAHKHEPILDSPLSEKCEADERGALPALPDPNADVFASLPPVDRGRHAWTFLVGATVMETIVWGLPYSVGVLHAYWAHEMFPGNVSTITLAATLMNGLLLVAAGLFAPVLAFFSYHTVYIQLVGLVCGTASLVCSAFVTRAWHLIITLGFLYPLSMLMWLPCATYLYEWFHARRGLAFGILCAGAAIGGTVFPLMGEALLKGVGYKGTMYALGGIFGGANVIAMFFVKRRIPFPSRRSTGARPAAWPKLDYSFLRQRAVYVMGGWVLLSAMASFLPSLWMPVFATDIGAMNGTSLVAIMYAASVVGSIMMGWLVDRYQPRIVVSCACGTAGLAAWLLWGFGTNDGLLVTFCIIWGLTALCSAAVWGRMIHHIAKDDHMLPGLITSLMIMLRGIGNFVSGPLSTALMNQGALKGAMGAYKTNYGAMLMFTGAVTFVGGVTSIGFPKVRGG
ncbi:hypothetical protein CcaverHIS002_0700270 [Cutaneotrichosporon cavernicola]|nr:hypothetical protein CcaverHIS002_0700270 [Cutaneotrichosporon cavernicola]